MLCYDDNDNKYYIMGYCRHSDDNKNDFSEL